MQFYFFILNQNSEFLNTLEKIGYIFKKGNWYGMVFLFFKNFNVQNTHSF